MKLGGKWDGGSGESWRRGNEVDILNINCVHYEIFKRMGTHKTLKYF